MYPDISTTLPARTGLKITLMPLLVPDTIHGDGKNWDAFCVLGAEDENGNPTAYAVSLAIKGTTKQVRKMLLQTKGRYVAVEGVFGEEEHSADGQDVFRRVRCKVSDITPLDMPLGF